MFCRRSSALLEMRDAPGSLGGSHGVAICCEEDAICWYDDRPEETRAREASGSIDSVVYPVRSYVQAHTFGRARLDRRQRRRYQNGRTTVEGEGYKQAGELVLDDVGGELCTVGVAVVSKVRGD